MPYCINYQGHIHIWSLECYYHTMLYGSVQPLIMNFSHFLLIFNLYDMLWVLSQYHHQKNQCRLLCFFCSFNFLTFIAILFFTIQINIFILFTEKEIYWLILSHKHKTKKSKDLRSEFLWILFFYSILCLNIILTLFIDLIQWTIILIFCKPISNKFCWKWIRKSDPFTCYFKLLCISTN